MLVTRTFLICNFKLTVSFLHIKQDELFYFYTYIHVSHQRQTNFVLEHRVIFNVL